MYTNDNNEIIVGMYDEMIILIIEGNYTGGIPHQEPPSNHGVMVIPLE